MSLHTSWSFVSLLSVPPDLAQCIPIAINESDDVVKRILSSQLIHAFRPDHVFNVEVRYALSDLRATKIKLEGYVQTSKPIDVYILQRWSMRSGVQSGGNAVAPRRTRSFGGPLRIIAISYCTENLPSIREDDHQKRKRCHSRI
jgi:hypothetical protein